MLSSHYGFLFSFLGPATINYALTRRATAKFHCLFSQFFFSARTFFYILLYPFLLSFIPLCALVDVYCLSFWIFHKIPHSFFLPYGPLSVDSLSLSFYLANMRFLLPHALTVMERITNVLPVLLAVHCCCCFFTIFLETHKHMYK